MTITAIIVADSIGEHAPRLTTLQLRYPKFIHGEFMTHRVFSRNASSSRAIPVARLIQDVIDDPAIPIHWGANQKGMSAASETDALVMIDGAHSNKAAWLYARDQAVAAAQAFSDAGYHKQIVNRLLEPFYHINVVVTATQWSNFFALRCHPDAQPEMRALADAIFLAMVNSEPVRLEPGQWHLPYATRFDVEEICNYSYPKAESSVWPKVLPKYQETLTRLSVARCARVSYLTQDGRTPDVAEDLALYDRLIGSVPLHASPAEHQATPVGECASNKLDANFGPHWIQFRKTLPGECQ